MAVAQRMVGMLPGGGISQLEQEFAISALLLSSRLFSETFLCLIWY